MRPEHWIGGAVLMTALIVAAPAFAQTPTRSPRPPLDVQRLTNDLIKSVPNQSRALRSQSSTILFGASGRRLRTKQQRWAALGAIGGLVGAGYLGAKIEGDSCRCDDPGLKGFLTGAPIGAIAGGVIAWRLAR